jgi:septal ring factor EnvC (AmiA/AmiB activator)
MGAVSFFILWAAVSPSGLLEQMSELREELNQVKLEKAQVVKDIEVQAVFMDQLAQEKKRVGPMIEESGRHLEKMMKKLPVVSRPPGHRLLPFPTFDIQEHESQAAASAVYDVIAESTAELVALKRHYEQTEHQLEVAHLAVEAKQSHLQELERSVRARIVEKEAFLRRLQRNPAVLDAIKDDASLAKIHADEEGMEDLTVPPRGELEDVSTFAVRLPVSGKLFRSFGKVVHPRYQTVTESHGVHLAVETGTDVRAVLPGEVVFVGQHGLFGQIVMLKHPSGLSTLYSGFSKINVAKGDHVDYQQSLGLSGHGYSLEYEGVYFEVRHHSTPLNPLAWMRRWNAKLTLR